MRRITTKLALAVPALLIALSLAGFGDSTAATTSSAIVKSRLDVPTDPMAKPRLIILTDGEIDDQDTFRRFLYYADDFNIVGMMYQASEWHWCGDGTRPYSFDGSLGKGQLMQATFLRHQYRCPGDTWMTDDINNYYAQIYPSLAANDPNYPTAAQLAGKVYQGNYDFEGEYSHDTPGSNAIMADLLDNTPGPLYVLSWGGSTTLARALLDIQNTYQNTSDWPALYDKISKKLVYSTVQNQDLVYQNYIGPNWPDVKFILDNSLLNNWGYGWRNNVPAALQTPFKGPWIRANLLTNSGPLMSTYFTWGDCQFVINDENDNYGVNTGCPGPTEFPEFATPPDLGNPNPTPIHLTAPNLTGSTGLNDMISEGDTPSYLDLIPNGLNPYFNPTFGDWGGRYAKTTTQNQTPAQTNSFTDGNVARDVSPYTTNTTTLAQAANAGDSSVSVSSSSNQAAGDVIKIDTTGTTESRKIASITAAASTTLLSPATSGTTNIKVPTVTGWSVGQLLQVDTGANVETVSITNIGTAGVATTLAASAAVGATNIKVASVAGLNVGDSITVDTGANLETVSITNVGTAGSSGTGVDISPALTKAHNGGFGAAAVRDQTNSGSGVTVAPALTLSHAIGASVSRPAVDTLTTPLGSAHPAGATVTDNYSSSYTGVRWDADLQNDFAARVWWGTHSYAQSNHQPVVSVPATTVAAEPGQTVTLSSTDSDPDGNSLTYLWWHYQEAGTYPGAVTVSSASSPTATFTVPPDATNGQTIHMILDVTDNGTPALTSYARVVVTVGSGASISSSASSSVYGQPLTFTATIPQTAGFPLPTGNVQFTVDGSNLGSPVALDSTGKATLTTTAVPAGSHQVRAVYLGDGTYGQTTSDPVGETVAKASLTVTADAKSRQFGAANPALTATLSGFVNGQTLATSGVTGSAACTTTGTPYSAVGAYPITCTTGSLSATNYSFDTFVSGTLTVSGTGPCLSGNVASPVTVGPGQAVCVVAGAKVTAPITVNAGGSLDLEGATITAPIRASSAAVVRVCGSTVTGPVTVSGSTGLVLVGGDGATGACAGNSISGPVKLTDNAAGVEFNGNNVTGPATITGNTGTLPSPDSGSVHATDNTVSGPANIQQ